MRRIIPLAFALFAAGCKLEPPFERASPYDADGIFVFSLEGPDSAHHLGDKIRLTLVTDPPLPDDEFRITWVARSHIECLPKHSANCANLPVDLAVVGGAGQEAEFTVIDATAEYRRLVVGAFFGRVEVGRDLLIGQKVASLELSCSPWTEPEDDCTAPVVPATTIELHTRMRDVANNVVRRVEYAIDRAVVTVRDPAIATPIAPGLELAGIIRLAAVSPGSTWVVTRIDEGVDSVRITVAP